MNQSPSVSADSRYQGTAHAILAVTGHFCFLSCDMHSPGDGHHVQYRRHCHQCRRIICYCADVLLALGDNSHNTLLHTLYNPFCIASAG